MTHVVRITTAILAAAIVMASASADAQTYSQPGRRARAYNPTPTLSPYLDYFRAPMGPLDSYHEYVRPRLELQRTLTQQDQQLRTQQREIRTLNSQWGEAQRTGTIAPTGVRAGFFNYSHFYPTLR
ncbi:MAG: hypothetical protein ACYC6Y_22420 [Thermoguttaceae bacterium]